MLTKPVDQVTASDAAGCEIEHEALLVVYAGIDFAAVENEEDRVLPARVRRSRPVGSGR